jgi:hypothetical protein
MLAQYSMIPKPNKVRITKMVGNDDMILGADVLFNSRGGMFRLDPCETDNLEPLERVLVVSMVAAELIAAFRNAML